MKRIHIEGLKDVGRFEEVALKALARAVPIVALKTGSSTIGAELTVSHTGSLLIRRADLSSLPVPTGLLLWMQPVKARFWGQLPLVTDSTTLITRRQKRSSTQLLP